MYFIQSFWLNKEYSCGWLDIKSHLFSWALGVTINIKHFSCIKLVTDKKGADLLKGDLDLPFHEISLALENTQTSFPDFWVLKKIHSYALQNEPFLHLDSDAYLFKQPPVSLLSSPLFAQNYEYDHSCYVDSYQAVRDNFIYQPTYIQKTQNNRIPAANAGLIGGQDFAFFKYFEKKSMGVFRA